MPDREDYALVDATEVIDNLNRLIQEFPLVADQLVEAIAIQILAMAQQLVPVYEGKPYIVKRPGQPAIQHVGGYLRSTLYLKQVKIGVWEVGATAEYAAAQHEHPEWRHVHGEGKFIEKPLLRFGLGGLPRQTAEKLLKRLQQGMNHA